MTDAKPIVVVILASAGRPELLGQVLQDLQAQTRPADRTVVVVPDERSLPPAAALGDAAVAFERGGLAAQRNAGMREAEDADLYVFFDDDAVPHPLFLERAVRHFGAEPDVIGLTGTVLLDGAASDEIPRATAERSLAAADLNAISTATVPSAGLYGCNFAVRRLADAVRFDARLPLYSWLEDRDFSSRLAKRGRLVRAKDCMIVHLGAKSGGRTAHTRLGYTQVMNPAYFLRKRSFGAREALWEILRPGAKNVVYSVRGPDTAWRRQRLRGNLIALSRIARGRFEPERMTELD